MLASLRKFSGSIYAKIFLAIVIIPFVFWGMGGSIVGGSKNILLIIDKEKYSIQDFADFIKTVSRPDEKISSDQVEELLSIFIGEKLIEKEINYFGIRLSNNSLSELIKNQKDFKRDNKFSRVEYEKFLIKNNIPVVIFETNLAYQEKKKQLLDYIGGGLVPPKFLINISYDKMNQKRDIQLIDLGGVIKKKLNFSEEKIISYYADNKDNYKEIYKSVKLIELNPSTLTGSNEFNDIFFRKIDEIDNIIMQGLDLDYIVQKFDLVKPNTLTFNVSGKDTNSKLISTVSENLSKKIFLLEDSETTSLIEAAEKYFLVEVIDTKNIIKNIKDINVRKDILTNLKIETTREYINKIGSKINQNSFDKSDFDKLSKNENISVKKISLNCHE